MFAFLFSTTFVLVAQAHGGHVQSSGLHVEASVDGVGNGSSGGVDVDVFCDMHCHNHMGFAGFVQSGAVIITEKFFAAVLDISLPSFINKLKRPPKI